MSSRMPIKLMFLPLNKSILVNSFQLKLLCQGYLLIYTQDEVVHFLSRPIPHQLHPVLFCSLLSLKKDAASFVNFSFFVF